jgi:hypothetical protein
MYTVDNFSHSHVKPRVFIGGATGGVAVQYPHVAACGGRGG